MSGLREALEETYDELDSGTEAAPVAPEPEEAPAVEEAPVSEGRSRNEDGTFAAKESPAQETTPPTPAAGRSAAAGVAAHTAPAAPSLKAPPSLNALEREAWAKGDAAALQKALLRLDGAWTKGQSLQAEKLRGHEQWNETTRPYEALIRSSGQPPQQYVGNLLQTAHALSYSDPATKANLLAGVIAQFNVDPQLLDRALVARMNGQVPQQQAQQQFRDPRLDQFFAQQSQQRDAEADDFVGSLSSSKDFEFFNDVGTAVADILDTWKAQGKTTVSEADIKRAYDIACNLDQNVASTLQQRKAAESARTAQAATNRAKQAAGSIRSNPSVAASASPSGRRQVLEAAYDDLDR